MKAAPRLLVPAVGAALAACAVLAVLAASRAAETMSSPLLPAGGWKHVFVAGTVAAFALYCAGVFVLRRSGGSLLVVAAVAVVVQLAALVGPVLLSRDVYAYWAYARVATAHGGNPYVDVPGAPPDDPAVTRMGSSWLHTPTLYGPVFTAGSELVAVSVRSSPTAANRAFRSVAALSMLAILLLVAALARNRAFAVAFVGWNPLLAFHAAGGGHNDALMMALSLGALLLAQRGRPAASGALWALAIGVKWVAAGFAGLVLLAGHLRDRRLIAGLAGGIAVIAVAATGLYGTHWVEALNGLSSQARRTGSLGLAGWLADLGLGHRASLAVIGSATLAAGAFLAVQAWRGRLRLGLAGVLAAALQGWLNPWYAVWGVALAAPEEDGTAQVLAVALSALVLRDALPL
jgi:alpha-1,6-mannosyltransferase